MSNDVTFEELEKTAFEFAKAMGAGTGVNLSINAMKRAETWHAESSLRESLYNAQRASWHQSSKGSGNSTDDFVAGETYWVVNQKDNKIMQAKFSKFADIGHGIEPLFHEDGNTYVTFAITHYIEKEEGDKILADTPPKLPAGLKRKKEEARPIPTMRGGWQSR